MTRRQLESLVFIRTEVNRLIAGFKKSATQQRPQAAPAATSTVAGGDGRSSAGVKSVVEAKPESGRIPSICPRRRLEEYMRSMHGVLTVLAQSVRLGSSDDEKKAEGAVPVGELVAELRGMVGG